MLVEIASAVAAVEAAVAVEHTILKRNADVTEAQRMQLRIGVNIDEVIVDGDDIFGDGVSVAARLEALAEASGIAISDDAWCQVHNRIDVA